MTPISSITGLPDEVAEFLTAAGIRSADQLSVENAGNLHRKLELIAWQRGRSFQTPAVEQLDHWISVAGMLSSGAIPEALNVEDIPEAVVASPTEKAWMPPSLRAAMEATSAESVPDSNRPLSAAPPNAWRKVDPSNFATLEDYSEGRSGLKPLSRESLEKSHTEAETGEEADETVSRRVQRLRSTGEALSRWVKRGVVHPRPFHTWCGAVVSVVWRTAFLAGIAGFIYLVVRVETPSDYKTEVIAGFVILAVLGALQLHFAGRSRCRICSCNLFFSKNCLKNRKAHRFPLIGYVASLSLHLLVFGWFRCMYCGTAIRLRPSPPRRVDE